MTERTYSFKQEVYGCDPIVGVYYSSRPSKSGMYFFRGVYRGNNISDFVYVANHDVMRYGIQTPMGLSECDGLFYGPYLSPVETNQEQDFST